VDEEVFEQHVGFEFKPEAVLVLHEFVEGVELNHESSVDVLDDLVELLVVCTHAVGQSHEGVHEVVEVGDVLFELEFAPRV